MRDTAKTKMGVHRTHRSYTGGYKTQRCMTLKINIGGVVAFNTTQGQSCLKGG